MRGKCVCVLLCGVSVVSVSVVSVSVCVHGCMCGVCMFVCVWFVRLCVATPNHGNGHACAPVEARGKSPRIGSLLLPWVLWI